MHSAVDTPGLEMRAGVRSERALPLFHDRLGLAVKVSSPPKSPAPIIECHEALSLRVPPGAFT